MRNDLQGKIMLVREEGLTLEIIEGRLGHGEGGESLDTAEKGLPFLFLERCRFGGLGDLDPAVP